MKLLTVNRHKRIEGKAATKITTMVRGFLARVCLRDLKKEQNDIEFIGSGIQENYEWAKKVLWHSRRTGGYKSIVQEVVPVKSEDPL